MNNITIARYSFINGLIFLGVSLVGILFCMYMQIGAMYMAIGLPAIMIVYSGIEISFELFILSSVLINMALFLFIHGLLVNVKLNKLGYVFTVIFMGLNIIFGYYLNIIFSL